MAGTETGKKLPLDSQAKENLKILAALYKENKHSISSENRIRIGLEIAHVQVLLAIHDQLKKIHTRSGD